MFVVQPQTHTLSTSHKPLVERQREHLRRVQENFGVPYNPEDCMHNHCTECVGTGVRTDGSPCIHGISCPCARCTIRC